MLHLGPTCSGKRRAVVPGAAAIGFIGVEVQFTARRNQIAWRVGDVAWRGECTAGATRIVLLQTDDQG